MSAHREGALASSWHWSAKSHRSPSMRSAVLALASATRMRRAVSASRPIAAYSPLRERERPMVIFIFVGESPREEFGIWTVTRAARTHRGLSLSGRGYERAISARPDFITGWA